MSTEFDSYELTMANTGENNNHQEEAKDNKKKKALHRSAMKKPGQSRSAGCSQSMLRRVNFTEVNLREYGMVLGDNPAVSHGAPVQLEWEPQEEHDPVHIDNYEKARSLWRAKDRRGFLLNAHKRVKILFAAGYTIDEIAKATMDMKEIRQMRAESLKTQGMVTSVIMGLLSGAAETTGHTVRTVKIIPGAITRSSQVLVNGTSKAVVGVGTEMFGLTNRVVNSTANAVKQSSSLVTGATANAAKGTGKVVVGTGKFVIKGTTGVVKGTGKVITKTGEVGVGVVKGTGNVMMGSTKAVAKGTGVLFAGAGRTGKAGLDMMVGTSRRISKLVTSSLDSSSSHGSERRQTNSLKLGSLLGGPDSMDGSKQRKEEKSNIKSPVRGRSSVPRALEASDKAVLPEPGTHRNTMPALAQHTKLERPASLDRGRGASLERRRESVLLDCDMNDELREMSDFLMQLEGMDKHQVEDVLAAEQDAMRNSVTLFDDDMPSSSHTLGSSLAGIDDDDDDDDDDDTEGFEMALEEMPLSPAPPRPASAARATSSTLEEFGGLRKERRATTPPPPSAAKRAVSSGLLMDSTHEDSNSNFQDVKESLESHSSHTPQR